MKGLVLTYLLAYGAVPVALLNPFWGVCAYWIFDVVRPQYLFAWAGPEGSFSEMIAVATLIGWSFRRFGNWQFGRGRGIVIVLLAHCCWTLLSALAAPDQAAAQAYMGELAKRTSLFLLAVTLADSPRRVRTLVWVLVGSAGYVALELNLRYLAGVNEAKDIGYGGMDNNSLAISLVTCIGPAVFLGFYMKQWWLKAAAWGAAALIGHTILLTFSRGGLLGLIVAGCAAVMIVPKRPRYLLVLAIVVGLGLRLAGPELRDRFATTFASGSERDESAEGRIELWMSCLEVMSRYPLLGVGPDHFPLIAAEFGWPKGKEAHSLWLQLGAETGVPALFFLGLFYGLAVRQLWAMRRRKTDHDDEIWNQQVAFMVVTSLCGFIVSAQFVTMEGLETPMYMTAVAVATLRVVRPPVREKSRAVVLAPMASPPRLPGVVVGAVGRATGGQ
jgi:probable O-glycosylation ligase (exosortase A-associated)